jgi:thiamine-phosphate pyrophosphorylase
VSPARNHSAAQQTPILCYVTDRRGVNPAARKGRTAALLTKIQEAISAGVDWVQLREKDLSAKDLSSLTREALRCSAAVERGAARTRIFVNDRVDVALAERAGGVHLGENSLRPDEVKQLLQSSPAGQAVASNFLVGVSCHSLESVQRAAKGGAYYIFFGPVFATPSKAQYGSPQGLARLAEVCRSVSIPVIAVGGISVENAKSCIAAGAQGIAAIRLFQDATDPARVVRELHNLRL